jgi:hypothetical protein
MKKHATVNISGQSMEDILLALDQVHEKVTGGYLCGSDRNESGSIYSKSMKMIF